MRRMLSLAAREADIANLTPRLSGSRVDLADASLAAVERRVERIREAAGARFAAIEFSVLLLDLLVTDQRRQGAEQIAARWSTHIQGARVTADQVLDSVSVLVGTVDEIVEQLQLWRERLGISYVVAFPASNMDAFAPVVARLVGT